ncbi:MAG: hypothetical protein ACRETL_13380, partial [Gammaproteobacteria bacterium]
FMDDRLPEDIFQKLAEFVDNPQFVNYVSIMNPAAKAHQAWFETFKARIIVHLEAQDVPDQPAATPLVKIQ